MTETRRDPTQLILTLTCMWSSEMFCAPVCEDVPPTVLSERFDYHINADLQQGAVRCPGCSAQNALTRHHPVRLTYVRAGAKPVQACDVFPGYLDGNDELRMATLVFLFVRFHVYDRLYR